MLSMFLRQQVTDRAAHDWILQDDRVAVSRVALDRVRCSQRCAVHPMSLRLNQHHGPRSLVES